MNEILKQLSEIPKGKAIQNADKTIGRSLYLLHEEMLASKEPFSKDIEDILLNLIVANERQLSPVTANAIGICLLAYFKSMKSPDFWKFLSIISEEIQAYNLTAIVILGILSKGVGSSFKAQLSTHITTLSNSPNPSQFPYICQCFRRILSGTGDFLIRSIPQIFVFIRRCITATAENLRNEAIKTIPILLTHAKIDFLKLLPVITPTIHTETLTSRYIVGKSLGKLLYHASSNEISFITKNYLTLLQNEKFVQTVCASMFTSFRFFEPIFLVSKLKTISKFLYNVSLLKIGINSMMTITQSTIKSIFSVCGSTSGKSICQHLVEMIPEGKVTIPNALVLITSLQHCEVPHKTLQQGLRLTYTLLECNIKEIQKIAISFFGSLNQKDPKVANLYLETFLVLISDAKEKNSLIGYSNTISLLTNTKNAAKIQPVVINLMNNGTVDSLKVSAAFLMATGLAAINQLSDDICQTAVKLINSMKPLSKPSITQKLSIKYISAFLLACRTNSTVQSCIPQFITNILQCLTVFPASTTFCIWSLISNINLSEQMSQLLLSAAVVSVSNLFNTETFDIDSVLTPFSNDTDLTSIMFGTKLSMSLSSIFTNHLHLNGLTHRDGCCRTIIEVFPSLIRKTKKEKVTQIIESLFIGQNDNQIGGKLMLVRSLLQKKSTFGFLPNDTLPKLFTIKSDSIFIKRIASGCISRFLSFYPMLIKPTLESLEKSKKSFDFALLTIAESASLFVQEKMTERCLKLILQIISQQSSPEAIFALSNLVKFSSDKFLIDAIEDVLYGGFVTSPPEICQFVNLIQNSKENENSMVYKAAVNCLLNFFTMKSSSQILASNLLRNNSYTQEILLPKLSLKTSPSLFLLSLQFNKTKEIISQVFMLQQQLSTRKVTDAIIALFDTFPIVAEWTDLCKRVVLTNCVPPSERKGDNRVSPTRFVLIAAMTVCSLLAKTVRKEFPSGLPCVDDIISIAFNSVQMKDTKIDSHAFSIASTVIREFSDVANNDGPFLALFTAQFHPMLSHALEEQRKFLSVADFVLDYLTFLKQTDAEQVAKRVSKLKVTKTNCLTLARLTSLLIENSPQSKREIIPIFVNSSSEVMNSCLKQEIKLKDFDNQILQVAKCILDYNVEFGRPFILLLLEQIKSIKEDFVLDVCSVYAQKNLLKPFDILYVISHVNLEKVTKQNEKDFSAFSEIDENAYKVISPQESSSKSDFLISVSNSAKGVTFSEVRSQILLISTMNQNFTALSNVIKNSDDKEFTKIFPSIFDSACKSDSESAKAIISIVSHYSSISLIDGLITHTVANYTIEETSYSILILLKKCQNRHLICLEELAKRIKIELIPHGIQFLCSLLSDEKTVNYCLEICKLGAIDYLEDVIDIKSVPRILHFLRMFTKICPLMQTVSTRICMKCLSMISNIPDRQKVVSIGTSLLKEIPQNILSLCFDEFPDKENLIKCLTPPKKFASNIKLISFGTGNSRRSQERGGWQTLTVGDSDESD